VIRKERLQDDLFYGPYLYTALITNMEMPLEEQIAWYRRRGQCENQIKELKWDFELRVLPSGDFFVNATYLRIITLAYNLFVALKTLMLPEPYRALRLKTFLFRLLGLPALIVHHARRLLLKLPRGHPHGAQFQALC
jgi:IS4 transposase